MREQEREMTGRVRVGLVVLTCLVSFEFYLARGGGPSIPQIARVRREDRNCGLPDTAVLKVEPVSIDQSTIATKLNWLCM